MPGLPKPFCSCSEVKAADETKATLPVIRQSSVLSDTSAHDEPHHEALIKEFREAMEKSMKKLNSEISQMRNDGREHVSSLVEKLQRDLQSDLFEKQERESKKLRDIVIEQHEKATQASRDEAARLSKSLEQILESTKASQSYGWRPPAPGAAMLADGMMPVPASGAEPEFQLTALLPMPPDEGMQKRQSRFVQNRAAAPDSQGSAGSSRRGSIVAMASRASATLTKAVKKTKRSKKNRQQQSDSDPALGPEDSFPLGDGSESPVQPLSEPEEEAGNDDADRKKKKKKKKKEKLRDAATKNWEDLVENERKKSRASFKAYVEGSAKLRMQERATDCVERMTIPSCLKSWLLRSDNWMMSIVSSHVFVFLVNVLIWANVIFIALQAQHRVDQARIGQEETQFFFFLDAGFSACFFLELSMRIIGERVAFFLNADARWNAMDCFFVALDSTNMLFIFAFGTTETGLDYFTGIRGALRALRLARAGRALRVFRAMKFINMIRLLIDVVQASLIFSVYVVVLFTVMLVFFSVIFMQATVDSFLNHGDVEDVDSLFGSVPQSMLTLFWCMASASPETVYDRLLTVSPMYAICLLMFIFFVLFAFMNSVTASFVESAISASRKYDLEGKTSEQLEIEHLLHEADTGNDGKVSLDELREHLNKPTVRDSLAKLGLDAPETRGICELMTPKTGEEVNINELAQVCVRFTRAVRSADFVQVLLANKRLLEDIAALKTMFFAQFQPPTAPL